MEIYRCKNCGRVLFHGAVVEGEISVRCKRCGFLNHFLIYQGKTRAHHAQNPALAVAPVRIHPLAEVKR